jgi:hypothetical protein
MRSLIDEKIVEFIVVVDTDFNLCMKSINSIMLQSNKNWKIHIISSNECKENNVYSELAKKHKEKIIHSVLDSTDYNVLHNFGIFNSKSKWISIVNSGSYYFSDFLKYMSKEITDSQLELILCHFLSESTNYLEKINTIIEENTRNGCFCIKTELAKKLGPLSKSNSLLNLFSDKSKKEGHLNKHISKIIPNILCVYN